MIIKVDKSFEKGTDKLSDKKLLNRVADIIENVQESYTINQIKNLRKLKGTSEFFRIRIGDYRLGITIENDLVTFKRFLHRKEIYRYFP